MLCNLLSIHIGRLEAWLIAVDKDVSVTVTGDGDVMSAPDDGVIAIGSGGFYALSAARALVRAGSSDLTAADIAKHSMAIASSVCVYTNGNQIIESMKDGQLQPTVILTQNTVLHSETVQQPYNSNDDSIKQQKDQNPSTQPMDEKDK